MLSIHSMTQVKTTHEKKRLPHLGRSTCYGAGENTAAAIAAGAGEVSGAEEG